MTIDWREVGNGFLHWLVTLAIIGPAMFAPGYGTGTWAGFWMGYYRERTQARASGDTSFGRGRWLEVLQHGLAGAMLDGAIWIRFLL